MVNIDPCECLCVPPAEAVGVCCTETVIVCNPGCVLKETVRQCEMPHCLFCSVVTDQSYNSNSMCDSLIPKRSPETVSRVARSPDAGSRQARSHGTGSRQGRSPDAGSRQGRSPDADSRWSPGPLCRASQSHIPPSRAPQSPERHQGCIYCNRNFYGTNVNSSTEEHLRTRDAALTNDLPVAPLTLDKASKIRQFVAERCGLTDCPEFMDAPYHSSIVETNAVSEESSPRQLRDEPRTSSVITEQGSYSTTKDSGKRQFTTDSIKSNSEKLEEERIKKLKEERKSSAAAADRKKSGSTASNVISNSSKPVAVDKPASATGSVRSMSNRSLPGSGGQNGREKRGSVAQISGQPSTHESTGRRVSVVKSTTEKETATSTADAVNIPAALAEEEEDDEGEEESEEVVVT
ncbi:hypothetical protein LSAT2_021473 [Lamellibrachia satsuma]|nr:hypothetical protein LSAT2_021473 [Lamellibrachia satsuma]